MKPLSREAHIAISDPAPLRPPLSFHPTSRIRSTNFAVRGGKLLSDRRIRHYAKLGYYGPDAEAAANGKPRPKRKAIPQRSAMDVLRDIRRKFGIAV